MWEQVDTLIIGGGQAGLALSYYLKEAGRDHLILEARRVVERWRSERWDSFNLVIPNCYFSLPGFPYDDEDPDGYMGREAIVARFEKYVALFDPPVRIGIRALALKASPEREGYVVESTAGTFAAKNVVVATGTLQEPRIPAMSRQLAPYVVQLHTSQYRNPAQLPPGAVLVVGSGQSGCQIVEDLYLSGRKVYLCVGSNGRIPRRYRGQDIYFWVGRAKLDTTNGAFSNHAYVSGARGGHNINLYHFARNGVVLLGHLQGIDGTRIVLAPDLKESLRRADVYEANFKRAVDDFIRETGMDAPEEEFLETDNLVTEFEPELILDLDLDEVSITTVIWATGFSYNFDWVHLPVFDSTGFPTQERGVTDYCGLYFLGMNWFTQPKSAFIPSVGAEAEHVAAHILARSGASA